MDYQQTKELLSEKGQLQLLEQFDALSEEGKAELLRQIEKIDWTVLNSPSAPHAGMNLFLYEKVGRRAIGHEGSISVAEGRALTPVPP